MQKEMSMSPAIEDILLIHRETGLLINHTSGFGKSNNRISEDKKEVFSSMLTAIKQFTENVLSEGDNEGELKAIVHSDHFISISTGPYTIMATVLKLEHDPLNQFFEAVHSFHKQLTLAYGTRFSKYSTDQELNQNLIEEMLEFLDKQNKFYQEGKPENYRFNNYSE